MMTAVTTALSSIITSVGTVVGAIVDTDGDLVTLLPLFAIGIGISLFLFAIKAIKSIVWGA